MKLRLIEGTDLGSLVGSYDISKKISLVIHLVEYIEYGTTYGNIDGLIVSI